MILLIPLYVCTNCIIIIQYTIIHVIQKVSPSEGVPLTCAQGYRHDEAEHNEHFVRHQPAEIAEQVTHCKDTSLDTGGDIACDNPSDGREVGRSWLPQPAGIMGLGMYYTSKGRRPLGEAWLRAGAIIAEFNMDGYGVAR